MVHRLLAVHSTFIIGFLGLGLLLAGDPTQDTQSCVPILKRSWHTATPKRKLKQCVRLTPVMTGSYPDTRLNLKTKPRPGSCSVDHTVSLMNLLEVISDEQRASPCKHGNIVCVHACYCDYSLPDAPRKCPIYRKYGEHDLARWRKDETWQNGCPYFEANGKVTHE